MSLIEPPMMSAVRITMISIAPITTDNTMTHTGAPLSGGTGGMDVVVLLIVEVNSAVLELGARVVVRKLGVSVDCVLGTGGMAMVVRLTLLGTGGMAVVVLTLLGTGGMAVVVLTLLGTGGMAVVVLTLLGTGGVAVVVLTVLGTGGMAVVVLTLLGTGEMAVVVLTMLGTGGMAMVYVVLTL